MNNYVKQLTEGFTDQGIVMSGKLTPLVSVKSDNLGLLHSLADMIAFGTRIRP